MADARRCDRCDRCYDPMTQKGLMARFINPVLQDSKNIAERTVTGYVLGDQPKDAYVDLCPDCTLQFVIFMAGLEKEEETK